MSSYFETKLNSTVKKMNISTTNLNEIAVAVRITLKSTSSAKE